MSFNIRNIRLKNPFVLAPMAGVNCTSFRLLCKEYGAGLVYTQMYHCGFFQSKLKNEGQKAIFDFINLQEKERPVAVQLIGKNKEQMISAAKALEGYADIIDINLGCPDPDMIKARCGAYFSKHPEKIEDIVRPVVDAVSIPVTAKMRIGWDSQSINGVKVAEDLQDMGVSAIAVHGRTAVQKYSGKANWTILGQIKDRLSIPIIGNGDVNNAQKAMEMLSKTGVDGVMVGRRAQGDPTIFARCLNRYIRDTGKDKSKDTEAIEIPDIKHVFERFIDYYQRYDSGKSFSELRTHALWFSKRAALGPKARQKIALAKDIGEIREIFLK